MGFQHPLFFADTSQAKRDYSEHMFECDQCGAQHELRSARFDEKWREPEGQRIWAPFLFVPFLWVCKEKVPVAAQQPLIKKLVWNYKKLFYDAISRCFQDDRIELTNIHETLFGYDVAHGAATFL